MGRITLSEARAIPDPIPADGFRFILGNVPGVNAGANVLRDLVVKCQTISLPGFSTEAFQATIGGYTFPFRGRSVFPGTLTASWLETRDYGTTTVMRQWREAVVNHQTGVSGQKSDYSLDDAVLEIYNQQNDLIDSVRFYGLFIQDLPEVSMDNNTTSGPMLISATLNYDYFEGVGMPSSDTTNSDDGSGSTGDATSIDNGTDV